MHSGSTGKAMHTSNKKYSMSVVFDALVLFARINFLKIEFRVPDLAFNCVPKPWGMQQDLYVCCAAAKKTAMKNAILERNHCKRKYHEIKNPQSKLVCHVVVSLQHLHGIVLLNRIHLTQLTYQIQKKTLVFVQPCPSFLFFFYVVSSNFQMSAWETGARQRLGKSKMGWGHCPPTCSFKVYLLQPPVKKVTSRQCINLSKIARI